MTEDRTPIIELHVGGPRDEAGFLLHAPFREDLTWDLENEILSARREWVAERGAWWIAASYLEPVIAIVLRAFPSVMVRDHAEDRLLSRDGRVALQDRLF